MCFSGGISRASQLRTSMGEGKGKGKKGNKGKRGGKKDDEKDWTPLTKLGRLVKEYQIIDFFLGPKLKEEVMKVMPVQKQTSAGQRTRFKAFVVMGDMDGHVGLGVKAAKEVATAMRGAIIDAKMNMVPVRRGYWGNKVGAPHTVPIKITAMCGSVRMRLIPAPKGTGIVAAGVPKKVLEFAGVDDCYTSSRGSTKTMGNFVKATFYCIKKLYGYLTPDFWKDTRYMPNPYQEFTDFLVRTKK